MCALPCINQQQFDYTSSSTFVSTNETGTIHFSTGSGVEPSELAWFNQIYASTEQGWRRRAFYPSQSVCSVDSITYLGLWITERIEGCRHNDAAWDSGAGDYFLSHRRSKLWICEWQHQLYIFSMYLPLFYSPIIHLMALLVRLHVAVGASTTNRVLSQV